MPICQRPYISLPRPQYLTLWFLVAILTAQIGPVGIAGSITVLNPGLGLIHRASSHIDANIRFAINSTTISDELISAETIRLLTMPGQFDTPGSLLQRPDTICPMIPTDEIATRPAQQRQT